MFSTIFLKIFLEKNIYLSCFIPQCVLEYGQDIILEDITVLNNKVLLATDDDFLASRCAHSLRAFNIELFTCKDDSAQIISTVLSEEPHLVLLCGSSTEYDYLDIIECINTSSLARKPLFVVVADTEDDLMGMQKRSSCILAYLAKPITSNAILTCVATYIHIASTISEQQGVKNTLLESTVTEVMFKLGIPANIKGYHYLRDALMLSATNLEYLHGITKLLYPTVATHFGSTPTRVERAIRHSIDVLWAQGNADVIHTYFGQRPTVRSKPTNSELIAVLADNIRLRMKQAI